MKKLLSALLLLVKVGEGMYVNSASIVRITQDRNKEFTYLYLSDRTKLVTDWSLADVLYAIQKTKGK